MPDLAYRYMTRFRCIAERCEDTCCAGLSVPLDQPSLDRLTGLLPRAELAEKVEPRADLGENVALFRHRPDGGCSFLTEARRCGLQERHGEAALSTACAAFPRSLNRIGDRRELTGTLSCPEVARLVVLAEDALELDPRGEVAFPAAEQAWSERRAHLRDQVLALLDDPRPLSLRLVFLAYLAVEPTALEHKDAIAANLGALDVPSAHWLSVADELLATRARASSAPRLEALRARLEPLDWPTFLARRETLATEHRWAERALERIARNAWLRGAGLDGSVPEALTTFLLRLGMLRIVWTRAGKSSLSPLGLADSAQLLAKYLDSSAELLSFRDALCSRPPSELFGFLLTLAKLHP